MPRLMTQFMHVGLHLEACEVHRLAKKRDAGWELLVSQQLWCLNDRPLKPDLLGQTAVNTNTKNAVNPHCYLHLLAADSGVPAQAIASQVVLQPEYYSGRRPICSQ